MSLVPRLILAAASVLFGLMMITVAASLENAAALYAFAGLCFAIAIACVTRGRARQFAGSMIALTVLLLGAAYVGLTLWEGAWLARSRRGASLLNALLFLAAFGTPAAAYIEHARFGLRRGDAGEQDPGAA